MKQATKAIHTSHKDEPFGAVIPPLYLSSTFAPQGDFKEAAFDYSRSGNPTRKSLEDTVAQLEGGYGGLAFASGMAAIHAVTMLLKAGDHIVASSDIYGGTYRLFHKILQRYQITCSLVPVCDIEAVKAAIIPKTRLLWLETIGNPRMTVPDIEHLARLTKDKGILLGVDNTFASPSLCQPLSLGADIVAHSATKYLGGHSDVLGGVLVAKTEEVHQDLYFIQNATGGVMAPLDSYLCSRGIKTLKVRIEQQSRSALAIARLLERQPKVSQVFYPGLSQHPQHTHAKKQFGNSFGGILTFEVKGGYHQAIQVVSKTKLFARAVSVGAVESLIEHPASMSHASYDEKARQKWGISDGMIRLSVGLEDAEDLMEDLTQAIQVFQ